MVYDEYDWKFDASTAPSASSDISGDPWLTNVNMGTCVGELCCSKGQVYDASLNVCIIGTPETTTTTTTTIESFVNDVLTKTQQGKYKEDFSLIPNYAAYK